MSLGWSRRESGLGWAAMLEAAASEINSHGVPAGVTGQRPASICRGYGLTIDSAFPLPGAVPGTSDKADLSIVAGEALLPVAAEVFGPYQRLGSHLLLTIPDVGRFLLAGPGRLEVWQDPAAHEDTLGAFLVASGLPMLLWQQGGVLLHASAVDLHGRALAISGASGTGKSTLAAALTKRGGKLIGDDSVWLSSGSTEARGLSGGRFHRPGGGGQASFVTIDSARQSAGARLTRLAILDPEMDQGQSDQLAGPAAVAALLKARHRPRVPHLLGHDAKVLAECVRLAQEVAIYRLGTRGAGVDELASALLALD